MYYEFSGNPFECNYERSEANEITKKQYDIIVKQVNDKARADREAYEESLKPAQEYEKKIQAKLREMAIKELEKEK